MEFDDLIKFGSFLISDELFSLLAIIATWGFFISGIDDLFIDIRYIFNVLFGSGPGRQIRMAEAEKTPEKPVAMMVPAWQEASVIRSMLMRNIANIDYLNYHIFVGTYPNDHDTQREVDGVIEYYRRLRKNATSKNGRIAQAHHGDFIHKVITPKPGPTNKADNLNSVYSRIKEIEPELIARSELSGPFEIFVMHDCEDVIHPKEFKLFSYLMSNEPSEARPKGEVFKEQFDFVQTPVFPLEIRMAPEPEQLVPFFDASDYMRLGKPGTWVAGLASISFEILRLYWIWLVNVKRYIISATYMDEFAEHHTKDMVVRRIIKGLVPSAGVGTAINKRSLVKLSELTPTKGIFNDVHLTEDYEISLQLKNLGARQYFAVEPVKMLKYKKGSFNKTHEVDEFVATKEFFPDRIRTAIKQKARWIMGITYQTMFPGKKDNPFADFLHGWQGNMVTKYTLMRDRKALITNFVNILGYFVFIYCLVNLMLVEIIDYNWSFAHIFPMNSYIWWLVLFDTVIMVERFLQRFHATRKIYGMKQAVYYLFRTFFLVGLFLGNFINFIATVSGTRRYVSYLIRLKFGKPAPKAKEKPGEESGEEDEKSEEPERAKLAWGKTDHSYLAEDDMREYVNRIGDLALRSRIMEINDLKKALQLQREKKEKLGDVLKNMGFLDEMGFSLLYAQQLAVPMQEIDPMEVDQEVLNLVPEDLAIEYKLVPLTMDKAGYLIIAVADPLEPDEKKVLESRIGRKVKLVITYQSDLNFSRERAYGRISKKEAPKIQRLGVYLIEKGIIDEDQLSEALYMQKIQRKPLGEVLLLEMKAISQADLDAYFKQAMGVGFKHISPDMVDLRFLEKFSSAFCRIYRCIPFAETENKITFGIANLGLREISRTLEEQFGKKVEFFLTPEDDLNKAVEDCYGRIDQSITRARLIGNRIVQAGMIDEKRLGEALKHQRELKQRLGEVLVAYGYVDELDFLKIYAEDLHLPVINLITDSLDHDLVQVYPHIEAIRNSIVPILKEEDILTFALPYDFRDEDIRSIEARFHGMRLNYVLAEKDKIKKAISLLYRSVGD